jgi:hypothetical protein
MKDEKLGRKTSPGFADPHTPVRVVGEVPRALPGPSPRAVPIAARPLPAAAPETQRPPAPSSNRPRGTRHKPLVEVEVTRERSRAPRPDPGGCYEIWTQNHVYAVDARMRCVEVREPGGGDRKQDHPFVGARLVGGQAQDDAMEMSYPLPRPGSFAVFEMRKGNRRQFTRTSAVERVLLRLRIVTIVDGGEAPSWEELVSDED